MYIILFVNILIFISIYVLFKADLPDKINAKVMLISLEQENEIYNDYVLELSVHIPNEDGTTNVELLNSRNIKVERDSNLLVDGVLVNEIESKVKKN